MLQEVLIDSPLVSTIPVVDNSEQLVWSPLRPVEHPKVGNDSPTRFLVRSGVAERLSSAAVSLLRYDAELVLVEGHRDLGVQSRYWGRRMAALGDQFPAWSVEERRAEAVKFVAPPTGHPPHSTGGAVDVVLFDSTGTEIDLGWPLNTPGDLMATASVIGGDAGRWRRRLVEAMEGAGFVNYPAEWWHFSYGDQYWAWCSSSATAVYGAVAAEVGVVNSI